MGDVSAFQTLSSHRTAPSPPPPFPLAIVTREPAKESATPTLTRESRPASPNLSACIFPRPRTHDFAPRPGSTSCLAARGMVVTAISTVALPGKHARFWGINVTVYTFWGARGAPSDQHSMVQVLGKQYGSTHLCMYCYHFRMEQRLSILLVVS